MSALNVVSVVGHLTRDPELRYTTAGQSLTTFGLAANRRRKVGDEWQDVTSFFDCSCWAELAEHAAESLSKGTRVIVVGRLEQSWHTRHTTEIVAEEIGASLRFRNVRVDETERVQAKVAPGPDEESF